ncbi:MAG: hypothetical protein RLZZ618_298 [Pseudomonadota bacterium]|jgi:predicted alpha/beta hydrolase
MNPTTPSAHARSPAVEPERIEITCADGERLQGHFFNGGTQSPELPVLLSPATGVKQHFYLRFAAWLAAQGHDVLLFDYRGIGLSRQGRLKDSRATMAEWGQLDQVAALDWLLRRTRRAQVVLLGHSVGAQLIGLLPSHHRVARLVGVSASTGWFKGMRLAFRLKARFGLGFLLPLGSRLKGYAPASAVGLGEDLPKGVARQWGEWCAAGGFATNAIRNQPELDFHAKVAAPITILYATDDDIATKVTVADLLRTLPAAPSTVQAIEPKAHGLKRLGHIDWFRSSHQAVWPLIHQAVCEPVHQPVQAAA